MKMQGRLVKICCAVCSIFGISVLLAGQVMAAASGATRSDAKYAWSDQSGWVNFGTDSGNVQVTSSALTGYAWAINDGWIKLDPSMSGVKNDGRGSLSGYAWNESLGWIDFSGVSIDKDGRFHGKAAGSVAGIITFDCKNCKVITDWTYSGSQAFPSQKPKTSQPPPSGKPASDETMQPSHIIEMQLKLNQTTVRPGQDLDAQVIFGAYAISPLPIELAFSIKDAKGKTWQSSTGSLTVKNKASYFKRLATKGLPEGSYTLAATATHGGMTDNRTVLFKIKQESFISKIGSCAIRNWWLPTLLILLLLIVRFWRRKQQPSNFDTTGNKRPIRR